MPAGSPQATPLGCGTDTCLAAQMPGHSCPLQQERGQLSRIAATRLRINLVPSLLETHSKPRFEIVTEILKNGNHELTRANRASRRWQPDVTQQKGTLRSAGEHRRTVAKSSRPRRNSDCDAGTKSVSASASKMLDQRHVAITVSASGQAAAQFHQDVFGHNRPAQQVFAPSDRRSVERSRPGSPEQCNRTCRRRRASFLLWVAVRANASNSVQIITMSTSRGKPGGEGWISGRQGLSLDGTHPSAHGGWSWPWLKHRWCGTLAV